MKLEITRNDNRWNGLDELHTFDLEDMLPGHKAQFYEAFSAWLAYDMWCKAPKLSIKTTLYAESKLHPQIVYLPGLSVKEPWAMETLAGREEMRDTLFMDTWMNQ